MPPRPSRRRGPRARLFLTCTPSSRPCCEQLLEIRLTAQGINLEISSQEELKVEVTRGLIPPKRAELPMAGLQVGISLDPHTGCQSERHSPLAGGRRGRTRGILHNASTYAAVPESHRVAAVLHSYT